MTTINATNQRRASLWERIRFTWHFRDSGILRAWRCSGYLVELWIEKR